MSRDFGNADMDAGPAPAPVIPAFDSGSPEPRALGSAAARRGNSQESIWERELLAGCQESFLLREKSMDALGGHGGERMGTTFTFLPWVEDGLWGSPSCLGHTCLQGGWEEPAHLQAA